MKSRQVRKLLGKHCRHSEEWHCGQTIIHLTGMDPSPRFDRRLEIFLYQPPARVDGDKIGRLLRLLDRLGRKVRRS